MLERLKTLAERKNESILLYKIIIVNKLVDVNTDDITLPRPYVPIMFKTLLGGVHVICTQLLFHIILGCMRLPNHSHMQEAKQSNACLPGKAGLITVCELSDCYIRVLTGINLKCLVCSTASLDAIPVYISIKYCDNINYHLTSISWFTIITSFCPALTVSRICNYSTTSIWSIYYNNKFTDK